MYNGFKRNGDVFSPKQADELNSAFGKTLDKIEKFPTQYVEPKFNYSTINVSSPYLKGNWSFSIENTEYHLLFQVSLPAITVMSAIGSIDVSVPDCYGVLCSKSKQVPCKIVDNVVYVNSCDADDYIFVGDFVYEH